MEIKLTSANTAEQLSQIEQLYMEAFPPEERKPFSLILQKKEEGLVDILSIEPLEAKQGHTPDLSSPLLGEAILARENGLALLDYFAISPEARGAGIGSKALQLLLQRYSGYRFLLEIESVFHASPDLDWRKKRKEFYLRGGMRCMDYLVCLFGVEMEVLTNGCLVTFDEYQALYQNIFGSSIAGHIKLLP